MTNELFEKLHTSVAGQITFISEQVAPEGGTELYLSCYGNPLLTSVCVKLARMNWCVCRFTGKGVFLYAEYFLRTCIPAAAAEYRRKTYRRAARVLHPKRESGTSLRNHRTGYHVAQCRRASQAGLSAAQVPTSMYSTPCHRPFRSEGRSSRAAWR